MNTGNSYIKISVGGSPIKSVGIMRTGQTTSSHAYDDGAEERGRNTSFFTLGYNNSLGNDNRLTDTIGTQVYADNVVLDWSTFDPLTSKVLGYYKVIQAPDTMVNISANSPFTFNTYEDWVVPNFNELVNIFNHEIGFYNYMNYSPFNIDIGIINGVWTSTKGRVLATDTLLIDAKGFQSKANSTSINYILVRNYTLTELGL
jgi:hypothetical protein